MAREKIAEKARELGRAIAEMRNFLRQHIQVMIKEHDLNITFELLEVLVILFRKDGIKQQEIAGILIRDKSSMTYLIDSLVKRRLVKRTEDESDKRNKIIYLTERGRALQQKMNPWVREIYEKATAGIKTADIEKAIVLVQQMNENLNQQ